MMINEVCDVLAECRRELEIDLATKIDFSSFSTDSWSLLTIDISWLKVWFPRSVWKFSSYFTKLAGVRVFAELSNRLRGPAVMVSLYAGQPIQFLKLKNFRLRFIDDAKQQV